MSDGDRVLFRWIIEQTYGVLPATPAFERIAGLTAFNKNSAPEHSRPNLKRGTYMPGKLRRVTAQGNPAIDHALIYGDVDELWALAFRDSWQLDTPGVGTDTLLPGEVIGSFAFEEEFTDKPTQELTSGKGNGVVGFSLDFPLEGEVTGSISAIGKIATSIPATEANSTNAFVTGEVMAGLDVASAEVDGSGFAGCIESIALSFESPLRLRRCLGSGLDPLSLGGNDFALGITLGLYNSPEAHALWKKMVDPTQPSLSLKWSVADVLSGDSYTFFARKLKATGGDHDWSGEDVIIPLELEGDDPEGADAGKLLEITRTPSP